MIIIPVISVFLLNLWLVVFGKKSFGKALPMTLLAIPFVLYFSQFIFKTFAVGILLLLILAIAAIPVTFVNKKKDSELLTRLFSYGFYCFLAIAVLVFMIDCGRRFTLWDEFSHWGKMVKEMLRLDSFYCVDESNLTVHKDYPPFIALFELFWCNCSLGYSETAVTMALHFFEFSLIAPWVAEKAGKNVGSKAVRFVCSLIITVVIGAVIIAFDEYSTFSTIYTDLVVAILYVFGIVICFDKEERNNIISFIELVLVSCALILTKQIALAFILLIWLFYTVSVFYVDREVKPDGKTIIRKAGKSLALLVAPMCFYLHWNHYVDKFDVLRQGDLANLNIVEAIKIIFGGGSADQQTFLKLYVDAIHTTPLSAGLFNMTYESVNLLGYVLLFVIFLVFKDVYSKKMLLRDGLLFFAGGVGYAFSMYVLYLYAFGDEMLTLASYNRYMDTYVLSEYLLLLLILVQCLSKKNIEFMELKVLIPLFGIVLLVSDSAKLQALTPQVFNENENAYFEAIANLVDAYMEDGSKVVLIADTAQANFYINYYFNATTLDLSSIQETIASVSSENTDYWDGIIERIENDGYVFIYTCNDDVYNVLNQYSTDELHAGVLYKASTESGSLVLTPVN